MYLLRLDDASEYMDAEKWKRMELLLDKYDINPIFGIIPKNADPDLLDYGRVEGFWEWMRTWMQKGWVPALHGYTHVFETNEGGINPVNDRSEFAGLPLENQRQKIRDGYGILKDHGIEPEIFFAPAHTFDENTLKALELETPIRVISDTVAKDVYYRGPFCFIPQQSGHVRKLPFKTVTFCYHPNTMTAGQFETLERFLKQYQNEFLTMEQLDLRQRSYGLVDCALHTIYFAKRALRRKMLK